MSGTNGEYFSYLAYRVAQAQGRGVEYLKEQQRLKEQYGTAYSKAVYESASDAYKEFWGDDRKSWATINEEREARRDALLDAQDKWATRDLYAEYKERKEERQAAQKEATETLNTANAFANKEDESGILKYIPYWKKKFAEATEAATEKEETLTAAEEAEETAKEAYEASASRTGLDLKEQENEQKKEQLAQAKNAELVGDVFDYLSGTENTKSGVEKQIGYAGKTTADVTQAYAEKLVSAQNRQEDSEIAELYTADLDELEAEVGRLERECEEIERGVSTQRAEDEKQKLLDEAEFNHAQSLNLNFATEEEIQAANEVIENYYAKYAHETSETIENLDETITDAQARLLKARQRLQTAQALQSAKAYAEYRNAEDFASVTERASKKDYNRTLGIDDELLRRAVNGEALSATDILENAAYKQAEQDYIIGLAAAPEEIDSILMRYRAAQENYRLMTDEEREIYNYLLEAQGAEAASAYLETLTESLNARSGHELALVWTNGGDYTNSVGKYAFSAVAGMNSALEGLLQTVSKKSRATSAYQYASQEIKEKTNWDGAGIGETVYDLGYTVGNMLPSIALSYLTSGTASALGASAQTAANIGGYAGAGAIGLSAGGNAYGEALREGYTEEQARTYGMLSGASEVLMEKFLGGISALGAKGGAKLVTLASKMEKVNAKLMTNQAANTAMKLLSAAASEGAEEYLQAVLEPVYRNIAFSERNDIDMLSEEALESALLGALTGGLFEAGGIIAENRNVKQLGEQIDRYNRGETVLTMAKNQGGKAAEIADIIENGTFSEKNRIYATGMLAAVMEESGVPVMNVLETNYRTYSKNVGEATTLHSPYEGITPKQEDTAKTIVRTESGNPSAQAAELAMEAREIRGVTMNGNPYTVYLKNQTTEAFREAQGALNAAQKAEIIDSIAEIIENARYVGTDSDIDAQDLIRSDYFETEIELSDGTRAIVKLRADDMRGDTETATAITDIQAVLTENATNDTMKENWEVQNGRVYYGDGREISAENVLDSVRKNATYDADAGYWTDDNYQKELERKANEGYADLSSAEAAGKATLIPKAYDAENATLPQNIAKSAGSLQIMQADIQKAQSILEACNRIYEEAVESEKNGGVKAKSRSSILKKAFTDIYGRTQNKDAQWETYRKQIPEKVVLNNTSYDGKPYEISISNKVYGKLVSSGKNNAAKFTVLEHLEELVANAEYVGSGAYAKENENRSANIIRYDYFESPFTIEGDSNQYVFCFDVRVNQNGRNEYRANTFKIIADGKINEVSNEKAVKLTTIAQNLDVEGHDSLNPNIREEAENVNRENAENTADYPYIDALSPEIEGRAQAYTDAAALRRYKGAEAYILNAKLNEVQELSTQEQQWSDGISSALSRIPDYPQKTYRTIAFDMQGKEAYDAFIERHKVGETVTYFGFTSSTKTADGYDVTGELKVRINIDGLHGKEIAQAMQLSDVENEVLFDKNSIFTVNEIYEKDGVVNIEIEERNFKNDDIQDNGQESMDVDSRSGQTAMQRLQTVSDGKSDVDLQSISERNSEDGIAEQGESLRGILSGGQRDTGRTQSVTENYIDALSPEIEGRENAKAENSFEDDVLYPEIEGRMRETEQDTAQSEAAYESVYKKQPSIEDVETVIKMQEDSESAFEQMRKKTKLTKRERKIAEELVTGTRKVFPAGIDDKTKRSMQTYMAGFSAYIYDQKRGAMETKKLEKHMNTALAQKVEEVERSIQKQKDPEHIHASYMRDGFKVDGGHDSSVDSNIREESENINENALDSVRKNATYDADAGYWTDESVKKERESAKRRGYTDIENMELAGKATAIYKPYDGGDIPTNTTENENAVEIPVNTLIDAEDFHDKLKGSEHEGGFVTSMFKAMRAVFGQTNGEIAESELQGNGGYRIPREITIENVTDADGEAYIVSFSNTTLRKISQKVKDYTPIDYAALPNMRTLIENAQYVGSGSYNKNNANREQVTVRYDYFETPIRAEGNDYVMCFSVRVPTEGTNIYRTHNIKELGNVRILKTKKASSSSPPNTYGTNSKPNGGHDSSVDSNIREEGENVNRKKAPKTALEVRLEAQKTLRKLENGLKAMDKAVNFTEAELRASKNLANGTQDESTLRADMRKQAVVDRAEFLKAQADLERMMKNMRIAAKERMRGEVRQLTVNADGWHNKKAMGRYELRTPERAFRLAMQDDPNAGKAMQYFVSDIHKNNAERVRWVNGWNEKMRPFAELFSETDQAAAQLFGENIVNKDEIPETVNMTMRMKRAIEKHGLERFRAEDGQFKYRAALTEYTKTARTFYDEALKQTNETLAKLGMPLIEGLENYMPHRGDGNDPVSQFINEKLNFGDEITLNSSVTELRKVLMTEDKASFIQKAAHAMGLEQIKDDQLNARLTGITETFTPQKQWVANFEHRNGTVTEYNLAKNYDAYIEKVSRVIFMTENIQRIRALETELRMRNSSEEIRKQIRDVERNTELTEEARATEIEALTAKIDAGPEGFINWLKEYGNLMAGKKSHHDRAAEKSLARKTMLLVGRGSGLIAKNLISFNVSSAITNFIPIAQAMGETDGKAAVRGLKEGLWNYFGKGENTFAEESDFMVNRKGTSPVYKTGFDKWNDAGGWMMETFDEIATNVVARVYYNDALEKGMSHEAALEYSNRHSADLMGDRSLGAQPTIMNSSVLKMFTQFQLENFNFFYHYLSDVPTYAQENAAVKRAKMRGISTDEARRYAADNRAAYKSLTEREKRAAALHLTGTLFKASLALYLGNKLLEAVRGSGATYSPLEEPLDRALKKTLQILGLEEEDEEEKYTLDELQNREQYTWIDGFWELLKSFDLPVVNTMLGSGRFAIQSPFDGFDDIEDLITGLGELDERWQDYAGIFLSMSPIGGYGQAKKMYKGTKSLIEGGTYTKDGALKYPATDGNAVNKAYEALQNVLFGASATDQAKDYYENYKEILTEREAAGYKNLESKTMSRDEYLALALTLGSFEDNALSGDAVRREKLRYIEEQYPDDADFLAEYLLIEDSEESALEAVKTAGLTATDFAAILTSKDEEISKVTKLLGTIADEAQRNDAAYAVMSDALKNAYDKISYWKIGAYDYFVAATAKEGYETTAAQNAARMKAIAELDLPQSQKLTLARVFDADATESALQYSNVLDAYIEIAETDADADEKAAQFYEYLEEKGYSETERAEIMEQYTFGGKNAKQAAKIAATAADYEECGLTYDEVVTVENALKNKTTAAGKAKTIQSMKLTGEQKFAVLKQNVLNTSKKACAYELAEAVGIDYDDFAEHFAGAEQLYGDEAALTAYLDAQDLDTNTEQVIYMLVTTKRKKSNETMQSLLEKTGWSEAEQEAFYEENRYAS